MGSRGLTYATNVIMYCLKQYMNLWNRTFTVPGGPWSGEHHRVLFDFIDHRIPGSAEIGGGMNLGEKYQIKVDRFP